MDRKIFFDRLRKDFYPAGLPQEAVDGVTAILDELENVIPYPRRWQAYILATAYHETARRMAPIEEYGSKAYFKKYEHRPSLGNTLFGDGYKFRGRGFVQLTGRRNYANASTKYGVDLLANPDLALEGKLAAKILCEGMAAGDFTGKGLGDFNTPTGLDFVKARAVVNGADRAEGIASYAVKFNEILAVSAVPVSISVKPAPKPPVLVSPAAPKSIWSRISDFFRNLGASEPR